MNDLISRQAAIDALYDWNEHSITDAEAWHIKQVIGDIKSLPSAQPEIIDEQAIDHLQKSGWMQNHDKQMYEAGLKERLADDSGSYDALLPSAQPEIIRCKDCKYWDGVDTCDMIDAPVWDNDFCSMAERRSDE